MRWEQLFEDLEAQLLAADAADLAVELRDRVRAERARIALLDRYLAWVGQSIVLHLPAARLDGLLVDAGDGWLLLRRGPGLLLVATDAVTSVEGLGAAALGPAHAGPARRFRLAAVLRVLARDRSPVRLALVDGTLLVGTIDGAGADHLDLAEHAADEPRRRHAVRGVRTVPISALATVEPATGTTSLA